MYFLLSLATRWRAFVGGSLIQVAAVSSSLTGDIPVPQDEHFEFSYFTSVLLIVKQRIYLYCPVNNGGNMGISQDLPSKPKAQMASGQRSHWLIESPTMFIYV